MSQFEFRNLETLLSPCDFLWYVIWIYLVCVFCVSLRVLLIIDWWTTCALARPAEYAVWKRCADGTWWDMVGHDGRDSWLVFHVEVIDATVPETASGVTHGITRCSSACSFTTAASYRQNLRMNWVTIVKETQWAFLMCPAIILAIRSFLQHLKWASS